jgi:predicted kinase
VKHLYLIRGLPGSGKSTFARKLQLGFSSAFFEADMYFIDIDGEYKWDASCIGKAHEWCQSATKLAMEQEWPIVVSNTFTAEKELKPYLDMAAQHGYHVTTLIVEGRHGNPSIHNVPQETIDKMRNRFSVKL